MPIVDTRKRYYQNAQFHNHKVKSIQRMTVENKKKSIEALSFFQFLICCIIEMFLFSGKENNSVESEESHGMLIVWSRLNL